MGRVTGKLSPFNLYSSVTTVPSAYQVGMRFAGENGKEFMFVKAGGSDLVVGNALQAPAQDTQFENMAVLAASIATTLPQTVQVTNGTTTVNANDFDGGSVVVYTTPDAGNEYTIVSHTTGASGATLTLTLDRPLATAWTTSTKVTMKRHVASGAIQGTGTTATSVPVGVAIYPIPANAYGFIQTKGMASVLSDASTFAVGSLVGPSVSVAGAAGVFVAGTARSYLGHALQAAASAHWISVDLKL